MTAAAKVAAPIDADEIVAEPFFKWAGGKRGLATTLESLLPERFEAYHEPCMGGAAFFFHLASRRRLRKGLVSLSDTCPPLVGTFRAIKNEPARVLRLLDEMPISERHYMRVRGISAEQRAALSDAELAAWFLYVNKTAFSGMYRVNRQDVLNVPWGVTKAEKEEASLAGKRPPLPLSVRRTKQIVDPALIHACSAVLRNLNASVTLRPFEDVLHYARKGDLVYIDPPYLPTSATADFTSYTPGGFGLKDHIRLRDVALELKGKGVNVMISNSDVPLIRELYESRPAAFRIEVVYARRSVNSDAKGRGKVRELVIR